MKINLAIKTSFFFSFINLCFFELFTFSILERTFLGITLSKDYFWHLIFLNIFIQSGIVIYSMVVNKINKGAYFRFILPILLNIGLVGFLFFSPIFILNEIVIIVSFLFFVLIFLNLTGETRFVFTNIASFFAVFLFFFNAYSLFYLLYFPYWAVMILIAVFSMLILFYKLRHLSIDLKHIYLFALLFSIIISEFFLFSFFWPLHSILLKSILLLFVYYLYWGFTDIHIGNRFSPLVVAKYIAFFVLMLILVGGSFLLNTNP